MRNNLIHKLIILLILVMVFILEILPNGAILNFSDGTNIIKRTYSYFSLMPFGYANFGPLITGVATIILMLLIVFAIFKEHEKLFNSIKVVSIIGFAFSLLPLLLGINYYSFIGLIISVLLLIVVILVFLYKKNVYNNSNKN